jgi:ribose transport system substrate-binding protein
MLKYTGLASAALALAACSSAGSGSASGGGKGKAKKMLFVGMAYGVDDPFHALEMKGVKDFANSLGAGYDVQTAFNNYDARLQVAQIEQLKIKTSQYDMIAVHGQPITPDNALPMVRAAEKAGVYITTEQFKPNDLNPWETSDHWISHVTYDNRLDGEMAGKQLFEAMGGKGKVAYISGALTDTSARGRMQGMKDALKNYPGIELLESQTGKWSRPTANTVAKNYLQKYGDSLTAIACGNDNMAMGALAALQAAGKDRKILVSGIDGDPDAVGAIDQGLIVSTMVLDSYWLGMIGAGLAYAKYTGALDVKSMTNDQRAWFARTQLVTKTNAAQFLNGSAGFGAKGGFQTAKGGQPDPQAHIAEVKKDVWARYTGPAKINI